MTHPVHSGLPLTFGLLVTSQSTSFRWKDFLLLPLSSSLDTLPLGGVALSPKHRFPGPPSQPRDNGTSLSYLRERNLFTWQDCDSS